MAVKNTNALKPTLCFDVLDTYDLKILKIADTSDWKHLKGEDTYLKITTPGRKDPIVRNFRQGAINYFNTENLDLECPECDNVQCDDCGCEDKKCKENLGHLPDGIYKITLQICEGDKFSYIAHYLRTTWLLYKLDKILIDLHVNCCLPKEKLVEKYLEIELLIKSAHANIRNGNIKTASCDYDKAVELADDFEDCVDKKNGKTICNG